MLGVFAAVALLLAGSWVVGHACLQRLDSRIDPGVAPAIGFSLILVVATAAIQLPGDDITAAICIGLLVLAGLFVLRGRPPAPANAQILLALAVMLVLSIPFAANGRYGVLGAGRSDDFGTHLAILDGLRDGVDVSTLSPFFTSYPLGPHSLGAAVAALPGLSDLAALSGVMAAGPLLTALVIGACLTTTLGAGRASACGALAGVSYLPAAYFGTGQFKELIVASLVVAFAFALRSLQQQGQARARDGVPLGVLVAGSISTLGLGGAAWPALLTALWLSLGLAWRGGRLSREQGRGVAAIALAGVLACTALLLPQAERQLSFDPTSTAAGGGDPETFTGFLAGDLPLREAMGIWPSQDLVNAPGASHLVDLAIAAALLAALAGATWWFRRRDPIPLLAALSALAITLVTAAREGPYITAKAMVVLAPTLSVVVFVPLAAWSRAGAPKHARAAAALGAVGLAVLAAWSSVLVLRGSPVGPLARGDELRTLARHVGDRPLLFIGSDDYAGWELSGTRLSMAIGYGVAPQVPFRFRPERTVSPASPPGFDSFTRRSLNRFAYAITTGSALSGLPPSGWAPVRRTASFVLWRRHGPTGQTCAARVRSAALIERRWRLGSFRPYRSGFGFVAVGTGTTIAQNLRLPPGRWELSIQYHSREPVTVTAGGRAFELPADLSPKGNFWRVGTVRSDGGRLPVLAAVDEGGPLAVQTVAEIGALAAVPRRSAVDVVCAR
jgi:hypothetical protein